MDSIKSSDFGSDYSFEPCSSDPLSLRDFSDSSSSTNSLVMNQSTTLLKYLSSKMKDLQLELEEERNAAASAANETMSMILRLQREKAEIQMEARQFKAFSEEKMAFDREKISALEDLVYEKEQAIEVLTYEVEAYKDRLLRYGLSEVEMEDQIVGFGRDTSMVGLDVYPCEYENPNGEDCNVEIVEKGIIGQSPRWPYYDPNSPAKETCFGDYPMSSTSDRVYTIDSMAVSKDRINEEEHMSKEKLNGEHWNSPRYEEAEKEKLYTRMQALEEDRESLRQIIVSMQTDKAQLVLLQEIVQKLSKENYHNK